MCGISGIFRYRGGPDQSIRDQLERSCRRMACRGPDGDGIWIGENGSVGLGHRRLAIIDLSVRGAQPMELPEASLVITFNGEIYNYRALRTELERQGERFVSDSDTEVVLRLYARKGAAMLADLRGMFAFALWDGRRHGMLLARDPFGIKPLYFADDGSCIRVASEVKALREIPGVDTSPNAAGHVGFFLWGHVPEPHTLYRGIRALPAGSSMWIDAHGAKQPSMYSDVGRLLADADRTTPRLDENESLAELRDALLDTVRHHLVADVDVGVFLSSGMDSTTIAALASEAGGSLRTVTLGFEEYRGTPQNEVPLATAVAERYGASHHAVWVSRRDFQAELPRLLERMDQPTIDGVNSFFVARAAAQVGLKVALSGLGGDELFGGYPSFRDLPALVSLVRRVPYSAPIGRVARAVSAPLFRGITSPKYAGLLEYGGSYEGAYLLRRGLYLPWELPSVLDPDLVREGWAQLEPQLRLHESIDGLTTDRVRVCALETIWYMRNQLLRDTDWASMTHSLEVRVPLVDWTLWSRVAALGGSAGVDKQLLARTPAKPLPDAVLDRAKTGFAIPTRDWLEREQRGAGSQRGLRTWARYVYERMEGAQPSPRSRSMPARRRRRSPLGSQKRFLVLVTDAYGGRGGIAKFNRDLLESLCSHPDASEVIAVPRIIVDAPSGMPERLVFNADGVGGKFVFAREILRAVSAGGFDGVICGHVNLMPLASYASSRLQVPLLLVVHGIEAWKPPASRFARAAVRQVDAVVSVSEFTKDRFFAWTGLPRAIGHVVPNCVDASRFGLGEKRSDLLDRYGLRGRSVLLTVGRLAGAERYKGFDEILDLLPSLAREIPTVSYLIVGEGEDAGRLARKAAELGVSDRVVFAGYVSEAEKADHYRLADAFVMPSRGEGFGIVYLEALACGIPVVASSADAGREAVLGGAMGEVVDPSNPDEIKAAILRVLGRERAVPAALEYFSVGQFQSRWHTLIDHVFAGAGDTRAAS